MRSSAEDRQFIHAVAQQNQLSEAAVETLFHAVQAGHGTAAQFNHPELGGMGQWLAGGMIMIGDFSNHRLKATIAQVCTEIAAYLQSGERQSQTASPAPHQTQHQTTGAEPTTFKPFAPLGDFAFSPQATWWPQEWGAPTASGAQNTLRYAYFAPKRRLAIWQGQRVALYDTQDHQINSVSQQQDAKQTVTFRSQKGELALSTLTKLGEYNL